MKTKKNREIKEFSRAELDRVIELLKMDDLEFYKKHVQGISPEEEGIFLKDLLENLDDQEEIP